jgi:hypothetical protein
MSKKRFIYTIALLVVIILICACNKKPAETPPPQQAPEPQVEFPQDTPLLEKAIVGNWFKEGDEAQTVFKDDGTYITPLGDVFYYMIEGDDIMLSTEPIDQFDPDGACKIEINENLMTLTTTDGVVQEYQRVTTN